MHERDDDDDDEDDEDNEDDDDEADGHVNHSLNDNDDMMKVDFTSGKTGQSATSIDPYITCFSPYGLTTGTIPMTPNDPTFPVPLTMSDPMSLDPVTTDLNYPFDPTPHELDLLGPANLDPAVSTVPWAFAPDLAPTCAVPEDSISLPRTSLDQQGNSTPTYKRVTLVLEDYEKGLMDQLLQVVSTSQGKSQIEILP